jgi:diacylglycerol kinase family enzyme
MNFKNAITLALGGGDVVIDGMAVEGAEPSPCVNAITVRRRNPADDRGQDEDAKEWLGRASYWLTALSNVATAEPFSVRIRTGTVDTEIRVHGFALCNGRTAGGGTILAPEAALDDGKLDLVLFPEQPLTSALATAFGVATGLDTGECARVRAEEARLEAETKMLASVDGEIATTQRLGATIEPGVFRFVVGPEAAIEQGA